MMNKKILNSYLKPGERVDNLHRKNYYIIQNNGKFCFGMDAVLLSGFARINLDETVLDLGTGTGIIPILLEAKTEGRHYTGLEIQEESADMAVRSVAMNLLTDKIDIKVGDIKGASKIFGRASFDVVTCNPPYMNHKHGLVNPDTAKALARHEILCTLEDVIREASKVLKPKGRFYMVHRPFRLTEIIDYMHLYHLEAKRIRFVHPYISKEPNMVLFECVKGGKPYLKVDAPLIVYKETDVYTDEIYDIYEK